MDKSQIYEKLERLYAGLRNEAFLNAETAYKSALADGTFKAAEAKYKSALLKYAKGEITESEFKSAEQYRNDTVKSLGLKLGPQFECMLCGDTGATSDGQECICFKKRYMKLVRESCGTASLPVFKFGDNTSDKEDINDYYDLMARVSENFPDNDYHVFVFSGKAGTGKTSLMSAVANRVIERGFSVQYLTAFELSELFLKYHTSSASQRGLYLDSLKDCDLLIIDDLGTEPLLKNVTLEYLFSIINTRIIRKRHVMISTNLDAKEISGRYNDRIFSRIHGSDAVWLEFTGEDLRKY